MIFIVSIVFSAILALFFLLQNPVSWQAIVYLAVAVAYEITFLRMYNDIKFLKDLHAEDFKKRDNNSDIYKKNSTDIYKKN